MKLSLSTISKILLETVPLFLFLLFILFSKDFILISNTILGNFLAFLLVVFYFSQDILYGIFFLLIVIFYYQTDLVTQICKVETFTPMEFTQASTFTSSPEATEPTILSANVFPTDNLQNRPSAWTDSNTQIQTLPEKTKIFKKQHCTPDLDFVYKSQIIHHPENIQNIYPEIDFIEKQCNPCDPNCEFNFLPDLGLETKDRIGKITKGNTPDVLTQIMDWANSFIVGKSEPFVGVGGNNTASYYS